MMRAVGGTGGSGMANKMKLMKGIMGGGLANLGTAGAQGLLKTKRSGWQAPKDRNKKKKR